MDVFNLIGGDVSTSSDESDNDQDHSEEEEEEDVEEVKVKVMTNVMEDEETTKEETTSSNEVDDVEDEEWLRGLEKNTLTGKYGGPKVAPIAQDIGMAWVLCPGGCDVGKYFVEIELVEDDSRVPWSTTQNVWSAEFTLTVMKAAT